MTTIVYAHPWAGSFNHAILETVTKQLDFHEENYTVIDLYADGFNPTMTANDLRLYNKGKTADKNADRYRPHFEQYD